MVDSRRWCSGLRLRSPLLRDVLNREQNEAWAGAFVVYPARIDQHVPETDFRKLQFHRKTVEVRVPRQHFFKQLAPDGECSIGAPPTRIPDAREFPAAQP